MTDSPTLSTRKPTRRERDHAISIVEAAGLIVDRTTPRCIRAFSESRMPEHVSQRMYRYCDIRGLLASSDPTAYALGAYQLGGGR